MKSANILKITITALFAALTCVATMIIKIPTPGTGGYIHPGDALVILSGVFLGPVYGFLAAAIGSAFSDLLGGYLLYAPATFIIKGITAAGVAVIYRKLVPFIKVPSLRTVICGIFSTIIVVAGYLGFESFIYGAGALASVPANIVQGLSGLVISSLLIPVLIKLPATKELNVKKNPTADLNETR